MLSIAEVEALTAAMPEQWRIAGSWRPGAISVSQSPWA